MTDFSTLLAQIQEYANRQDWSIDLVTGFVRQCEQKLNAELRIDRMIQTDQSLIVSRCVPLPDDWLMMDLVLYSDAALNSGWLPLRYRARDEFFRAPDGPYTDAYGATWNNTFGKYTIEGRQIYIGGTPDAINGNVVQISYYGEVPVFSDTTPSWVYTKFPSLYLHGSLMHADLHAVGEEDKAGLMKQLTEDAINKLNALHAHAKASGSRLNRMRTRSFG